MTLEEKIESLLPKKKQSFVPKPEEVGMYAFYSLSDPDDHNRAIDQCATNLKQAFEEGKICFVPSVDSIRIRLDKALGMHINVIPGNRRQDISLAILSLLTKGKDNVKNDN